MLNAKKTINSGKFHCLIPLAAIKKQICRQKVMELPLQSFMHLTLQTSTGTPGSLLYNKLILGNFTDDPFIFLKIMSKLKA